MWVAMIGADMHGFLYGREPTWGAVIGRAASVYLATRSC